MTQLGRTIGVSGLLFCLALMLTAYTSHNPNLVKYTTAAFSEVLMPLQSLNKVLNEQISWYWNTYLNLIDTKKDNKHLLDRLMVLESENARLLELASENDRLKSLLDVSAANAVEGPVADVIAYDPTNWSKRIVINRGSSDGVAVGQPVVSGYGVVGQILTVGLHTAQVLLLSDPSSGVDALIQRTRARGVLEGTGSRVCRLQFVGSDENVTMGDQVVTSGLDGVYPKGLMLGVVAYIGEAEQGMLFRDLKIKTTVDFTKLENVMVVTAVKNEESEE